MNRFRALVTAQVYALVISLVALGPAVAVASEWPDGYQRPNGTAMQAQPMGAFDGSSQRALKSDSNGILRTTEEYPQTSQRVSYTAGAAVAVTTGLKAIGNGYGISPYGLRVLHLIAARAGSTSSPMYVYLYSSDDNVTFKPLKMPMGTAGTPVPFNSVAAFQDTAKVDTVMITVPMNTTGVSEDSWYAFPAGISLGRYVQLWARRDSSTSTASTATLSGTWELREQ